MRIIFTLLLQCLFIVGIAQTGTIHVKKPTDSTNIISNCNFELIADSSLYGKTFRLSKFAMKGVSKKNADDFRIKLKYSRGRLITVSKNQFEEDIKDLCDTKKYKLELIEVYKSINTNDSGDYIVVEFTLKTK